ncbi:MULTISPECIES: hypothetical protein [unclassified Leptolyngbya]|uniref:hypothetical protein n=1 Tax=unclassified Leptolyngbya TaxID=2650499 RepID=UPI001687523C|nr:MULTISPECIES: hypothetical protein [unclassified Leptolyngbya]MBD1912941.1 hypothetical protein [Leptolyngbya sp. FACHB-8]MBD2154730.1 hypothetical protein [Leptolyngbya sp. FACHB-16]
MKGTNYIANSLAASLVLTGLWSLNVNAQPSGSWMEQTLGRYEGQIWAAGDLLPATTEFREAEDGSLEGSYTMNELGEMVPGTLSQCEAVQVRVMHCVWNDVYGTGNLEVTFSEDFSSFNGYWGEENSKPEFPWNGSR